jgi:hydrogenase maturation protein HypF
MDGVSNARRRAVTLSDPAGDLDTGLTHPVRYRLVVTGIVQGVGFRPLVYRLARDHGLVGWVLNSTEGVVIEVEGEPGALDRFATALSLDIPPRAVVDRIDRTILPLIGYSSFAIETSQDPEGHFVLISPDICVCDECLREMRDPANRRYRYPFINCTNCGPRFTIVGDIPYDRPRTSMSCFPMCPECASEYHDPADRRFHAQPNACPTCGPELWLTRNNSRPDGKTRARGDVEARRLPAVEEANRLLDSGSIVAVKGLGGFHLACDATSDGAVAELRRRKRRTDKPFAVMSPDADLVSTYCYLSEEERHLLESPQRPIVLLRRRENSPISTQVAPGNRYLGVMLPYTPLHYLLFDTHHSSLITHHFPIALVMTSGNFSEEPIVTGNREALERLAPLADAFLLHDRDIHARCDDSVTRVFRGKESIVRRSRGYVPFPVRLGFETEDILACGGQLKSTFCMTKGSYAFLSQHIGDLENAETLASFTTSVEDFRRIFRLDIAAVAHDLHPEYISTRYASELAAREGIRMVPVQHHHAHIAACMAENGASEPAIGVAFDGTGFGDDGHIWGGEFLICDFGGYRRAAHLQYLPLPGGDAAVRRPCRMAASYLMSALGPDVLREGLPPIRQMDKTELQILRVQIERGLNSPLTSSMGRLFDAVSSIVDLRHSVNYEGQAAIELEMIARDGEAALYDWDLLPGEPASIDVAPTIRQIVHDWRDRVPAGVISARFHNTVADIIATTCDSLRRESGISTVALSGGVFQNVFLLERACTLLEGLGFTVLLHHQVPANDGGISLGQAVIANRVLGSGDRVLGTGDRGQGTSSRGHGAEERSY